MKNFDLVTFLIVLAGRIQEKRHSKLLAREESLKAGIKAAQDALQSTVQSRVEADWRHQDIKRVK
jgi:hypothetical protein